MGLSQSQVRLIAEFVRNANKAGSEEIIVRSSFQAMRAVAGIRQMRLVYAPAGSTWREWKATVSRIRQQSHDEWPQPDKNALTISFDRRVNESGYVSVEDTEAARLPLEILTPEIWSALLLRSSISRMHNVSISETELIRNALRARDEERRHIARELHDDFGQVLTSLKVGLRWAEDRLGSAENNKEVVNLLSLTRQELGVMLSKIRDLSHTLYPRILDTLGLVAAVRELGHQVSQQTKLKVDCRVEGKERRLSKEVGVALYRCTQEAVSNATRHAHASRLSIHIQFGRQRVSVSVEDDGKGFDPKAATGNNTRLMTDGFWTIRQRMTDINGAFIIRTGKGQGTAVEMIVTDYSKGHHARGKNKTADSR